jgi:23S rRNA pseudouridine2605 synthase
LNPHQPKPQKRILSLPKTPKPPTSKLSSLKPSSPNPGMQKPATSPRKSLEPAPAAEPGKGERLQKILAAAGLGSRREIETWIEAGRVSVAGRVAKLGDRASPADEVAVDGKAVKTTAENQPRVLLYHKPVGEMVTRSDPQGRPTVFSSLPAGRWVAVGRLDVNSSGLLLFTDSGELANRLMHPRYEVEREYAARVQGRLHPDALEKLAAGVHLDDGPAAFSSIEASDQRAETGANRWYRVALREGRNREVRRLFEAVGARVSRLVRVRYGPIELPRDLAAGRWLELSPARVQELLVA